MPIVLVFIQEAEVEDGELRASLGYIMRPSLELGDTIDLTTSIPFWGHSGGGALAKLRFPFTSVPYHPAPPQHLSLSLSPRPGYGKQVAIYTAGKEALTRIQLWQYPELRLPVS